MELHRLYINGWFISLYTHSSFNILMVPGCVCWRYNQWVQTLWAPPPELLVRKETVFFNCWSIALAGQRGSAPWSAFSTWCSVSLPTHPSPKSFCKERCITKYKHNILQWFFLEEIPNSLVLPLHSVHSCTIEGLAFHSFHVTDQQLIICNQILHT